jgi:hypothetical protein
MPDARFGIAAGGKMAVANRSPWPEASERWPCRRGYRMKKARSFG